MQKLHFFLTTIIALWATTALQAQDREWKWAKAYSGNGDDMSQNQIVKSAFDDEGNVYIIGTFKEPAKIDGELIMPYYYHTALDFSGQIIAKFDIDGNLVWKKVIKYFEDGVPAWIQIRENHIYVMGTVNMRYNGSNSYLYYLDTLVFVNDMLNIPPENWTLPFGFYDQMTYFITFDLDGNVIDQHFLQYDDREIRPVGSYPRIHRYALSLHNPFLVDNAGNIYIFAPINFYGLDTLKPLYTIIDNERRDSFYIPEATTRSVGQTRLLLFKFSSNFDLLWAKPIVSHVEGVPEALKPFCGFPQILGLSTDEEDNFYISGHIRTTSSESQALQCQYPIRYYYDNTHYSIVHDLASRYAVPFLIKYNTNGNILWNQQLYAKANIINAIMIVTNTFSGNTVNEHSVFVVGDVQEPITRTGDTVFIDVNMTIPISRSNPNQEMRGFYVRYDKITGEYQNHGIIPAESMSSAEGNITTIYNYILLPGRYHVPFVPSFTPNILTAYFCDDGTFIEADTIRLSQYLPTIGEVLFHSSGYLFTHFVSEGSATFGDITVSGGKNTAFFGMMYNESLLTPYEHNAIPEEPSPASAYLSVYPNPTNADIYIRLLKDEALFEKAELYNLQGQKLGEYKSLHIPASRLSSGMYLLKVYIGKQAITAKFLKTN